mgnify:CR=1 FL=1
MDPGYDVESDRLKSLLRQLKDAGHEVTTVDIDSAAVGRHFANNFETISHAFSPDFINEL